MSELPRILCASFSGQFESDCACAESGASPLLLHASPGTSCESDCACSTASPAPDVPSPPAALWQRPPHLYRAPLPQEHELVFNPVHPLAVAVLNAPASGILDTFAAPRPLISPTAHQLAGLGLLTSDCAPQPNPDVAPHTLTAWLHVTAACNLHCDYCYAPRSGHAMSEQTGRAAVDTLFRAAQTHGFRAVKLKYAGGEPALNWSLVRALHRYAGEWAAQSGLELHEVVLSNGTLLAADMLDWLRDAGVRLMLSLDGVGAPHDAQRHYADGRGSFAQVARAIDSAVERGLRPYISVTVTPTSADGLAETVAFVLARDLPFNLNFVRAGDGLLSDAEAARLIVGVEAAFTVIEQTLPRRRLVDALLDRSLFGAAHTHPCGAGRNYLVIDPHGNVARCQMEMEHTVTNVWANDPLLAVQGYAGDFQNVSVEEKEGCRTCPWRYWCAGGCPLLAYRATGRSNAASPYCQVYRALYPALLRLEGLRLLKWQLPADRISAHPPLAA